MATNAFGDEIATPGVNAFGDPVDGARAASPQQAQDLFDALKSGYENSITGLFLRGRAPSTTLGEESPWYHRLAAGVASIAGDVPAIIPGAMGGIAAGTAVGGPVGGVIGGGAGGFAAPMALREALVTAYNHDQALSLAGVWDIAKAAVLGGGKGAIIGGATMGAGRLAGGALLGAGAGKVAQGAGAFGAELATLTTTSAALEGHVPTWQEFMDNAILLGGVKGAIRVAQGLRNNYAETGKTPAEQYADAVRNPAIAEVLKRGELPAEYEPIRVEERIKAALGADPRPEVLREVFKEDIEKARPLGEGARIVDWNYVTDLPTLKGVLNAVSDIYRPEIEAQRRGVVSNPQSLAEARALLDSGRPLEHKVGAAGNSGEILARTALLRDALNHTYGELQKIAGVPEAAMTPAAKLQVLAAIERVAMLNAEFAGVRAEAGRALQIFRSVKRDPTLFGEAQNLLNLAERKGALQDIAKLAATLKDPAQLQRFLTDYQKATTMQKVLEGWKAAILSGPQTHLANILGNTAKWLIEIPESALSATLYAVGKAAKGDPLTMAQYKARALAPLYGIKYGAMDSIRVAAEVWKGQISEKADIYKPAIEGKKGDYIRIPFRTLQVEDALFRTMAERAEAYRAAVDRAAREKLTPETAEGRLAIQKWVEQPELGLTNEAALKVRAQIEQAGAEAVFSQRLGPVLESVQAIIGKHAPALQFIVPFVRTPANLVSWAIQHVPGLNLMSGRWRADWKAGGERQARANARVMIGAGLTLSALGMAYNGTITGGGLFDREQGGTKRGAGWQPYSIKIGDTYYSYQRLEPVAKVLGLAADYIELLRNTTDEQDGAKIAAQLVLMFANATVSTTYLSGISNAMQAVSDPARYGEGWVEQYASSLVPKIIGQTVAMIDDDKREVDGFFEAIQSQLPYFREKLMPKRDVWGEPMKNDRWFGFMPVATSQVSQEKVKTEAQRLELAITDVPKSFTERGPFKPSDKRVDLTSEQRDVMKEVSGKAAMTILAPIVNAPDWERIPDFAKVAIYKKVIEGTRKQGAYAALPADDAARVKVREKIVSEIIKQQQAVGN